MTTSLATGTTATTARTETQSKTLVYRRREQLSARMIGARSILYAVLVVLAIIYIFPFVISIATR